MLALVRSESTSKTTWLPGCGCVPYQFSATEDGMPCLGTSTYSAALSVDVAPSVQTCSPSLRNST